MLKKLIEQYTCGFKNLAERKRVTSSKMLAEASSLIDVPFRIQGHMMLVGPEIGLVGVISARYFENENNWYYQVGHGECFSSGGGSFSVCGQYKKPHQAVEALALEMAECGCI